MTTDESIDRTLHAIDMIIHGEVAEPVLKLKQAQRVEWDTTATGTRMRLAAAGLGIALLCVAIDLDYGGLPAVSRSVMVQAIPAPQKRPEPIIPSASSAPKAYGAAIIQPTTRWPAHRARPLSRLTAKPAQPIADEALRAELVEDARRTRERNREELSNMPRQ